MNRSSQAQTINVDEIQQRCNTLILKLTNPAESTADSEAKAIVANARKTAEARFRVLIEKHVIDKDKNINPKLLNALQSAENIDHLLETYLVGLYKKAVEKEEAATLKLFKDEEKVELQKMQEKDKQ